jgi:hypothetical protein
MNRHVTLRAAVLPALLALAVPAGAAQAQGWMNRVKQAAKQGAVEAVTRKAEEASRNGTEKSIDAAAGKAGGAVSGLVGGGSAPAAGGTANGTVAAAGTAPGAASVRPGQGAWANYDFVPGSRVLFADDFTQETVGNFPRRLTHKGGAAEVVEWQGKRWLSSAGQDAFVINLPEVLPQQFTMEFDLAGAGNGMVLYFDGRSAPHERGSADGGEHLAFGSDFAALTAPRARAAAPTPAATPRRRSCAPASWPTAST